jgi:hypothetical protein
VLARSFAVAKTDNRKRAVKNHLYKKTAPARNGGAALMETEN